MGVTVLGGGRLLRKIEWTRWCSLVLACEELGGHVYVWTLHDVTCAVFSGRALGHNGGQRRLCPVRLHPHRSGAPMGQWSVTKKNLNLKLEQSQTLQLAYERDKDGSTLDQDLLFAKKQN